MKKKINDVVKAQSKKAALKMAEYYANVSCPLVVYQPKVGSAVKKLRKF